MVGLLLVVRAVGSRGNAPIGNSSTQYIMGLEPGAFIVGGTAIFFIRNNRTVCVVMPAALIVLAALYLGVTIVATSSF